MVPFEDEVLAKIKHKEYVKGLIIDKYSHHVAISFSLTLNPKTQIARVKDTGANIDESQIMNHGRKWTIGFYEQIAVKILMGALMNWNKCTWQESKISFGEEVKAQEEVQLHKESNKSLVIHVSAVPLSDEWLATTEAVGEILEIIKHVTKSRSFENSYIPENPRTPKPLTFSKNRLRRAKNRSNISPVAKNFFRKNDFFFSKNFAYVQTFFLCICAQSLYNTYLKRFVKKNLKKNAKKKKLHICTKNKKKLHICKRFRSRFFERNNGLGDIGNWESSRVLGNI
ncbi:hypothetical protein LXL04_019357 [Taraxacum kok-saghyz]